MTDTPKENVEAPVEEAAHHVKEHAVEPAAEKVEEAIPEPVKEEATHPAEEVPAWGKELMKKVDALTEAVATPVVDAVEPDNDLPGDGHVVPDESPVKKPWTHRKLW